MRMSKRPTKTVTETRRSNAVLNKSAEVLQYTTINSVRTKSIEDPLETPLFTEKEQDTLKKKTKREAQLYTLNTKEPSPES